MQLRKWAFTFVCVLYPAFLLAGSLKIEPSSPVTQSLNDPGTTHITVSYLPDEAEKIDASQKLVLELGVNGKYWSNNTLAVPMIPGGNGTWTAKLERTEKEFWLYLIFQVRNASTGRTDTNHGKYWDVVFRLPDGNLHFQGVEAQVDSYTGNIFENGIARTPDTDKALSILKDFMENGGRSRYLVLPDYWGIKAEASGDTSSAWQELSDEIRTFAEEHRADKDALVGALNFIQLHNDRLAPGIYPQVLRYLDSIDPELSKRMERTAGLNLVFTEKDRLRRATMMAQFIRKFPTDPNVLVLIAESFRSMRDSHDVMGAEKLFSERSVREPDWADLYATLASIYIESNQKLDRALELLDQAEKLGADGVRPPQRTAVDYVVLGPELEQSQAEIAYWRAKAYLGLGQGRRALEFAQKAEQRKATAARVYLVAQAYEATGEKQKAVDKYIQALAMPSIEAGQIRDHLESLWTSSGFGTKESLDRKLRQQQDDLFRKANYVPRLVDRPVPDYEFITLGNKNIKSADLRDHMVILNFWGTWCAPCLPELPGFQDLQRKHPEIFVAAVALHSEQDKISNLVARYKLQDLRIGQNDKLEETFVPSGVPVTYLIDHGRIRVIHQDSLSNVVAYLEADLNAVAQNKMPASGVAP